MMEKKANIEIIPVENIERWNNIVKGFEKWDIYYLNEYAKSLELHGDGQPFLIYYENEQGKLCYVMMQSDIAKFKPLAPYLEPSVYYDWATPYGYGGPLVEGQLSKEDMENFLLCLTKWCKKNGVVSQFFRFHPLLENQMIFNDISQIINLKKTVYIDTSNEDIIFKNMTPNNRNMVRKAQKNNIEIVMDDGKRIEDFIQIYEATMKNNEADAYYYFEKEYFTYLIEHLKSNIVFFYAIYQETTISASIFFCNEKHMHYHLSGTLPEYRTLGATNLLLTTAANWAASKGIKQMHLGGGVGIEDSLLSFKKHFNRNGLVDFCIGRNIFDHDKYEELVNLRVEHDKEFDQSKPYLVKYRG